jgi:D-amino-acid dehydrogenase
MARLSTIIQASTLFSPPSRLEIPHLPMKIAIVGAGVIGVTTAYELALDGHEVTVFERNSAVAVEASFANAGVIAPGYVAPWAAPGMPAKVFKHLFSRHAPVKIKFPLNNNELAWIWQWYRASKLDTYIANRGRMQALASYSRDRLHAITADLSLEFERSEGYMVLLRSAKDSALVQPNLQVLRETGVPFKEISASEARLIEPALNPDNDFFGAVHMPCDEVGNCREFTLLLKNESQRIGVKYEINTTVAEVLYDKFAMLNISNENSPRTFDAVVMCAGVASAALLKPLLKPLRRKLPLIPVYGYSISAAVRENLNAPRSALMDERYKIAISRLGNRVRVAGSAEIGGSAGHSQNQGSKGVTAISTLYKVLQDWFPGAGHFSSAATNTGTSVHEWKGARPMLPDGPPVIGQSGVPNIWLNLGHGSSGWALSCGSARVLADLIARRQPDIDVSSMNIERFS